MNTEWARQEFRGARLGDERQVKSIIKIGAALAHHSDLCLSSACGPAGRQAAHRIFEHEKTTVAGLIAGHVEETAIRAGSHPRVLVAQDTTMFVFDQQQITGRAQLNRREKTLGLIGHGALAMTPAGTPLGMVYLDIWGGEDGSCEPNLTSRRKVPLQERESYKWVEGLQGAAAALPASSEVIVIQDREGDVFALMAQRRPTNVHLLIRVSQNRTIRTLGPPGEGGGEPASRRGKLKQLLAEAAVVGRHEVKVPRRSARPNEAAVPERQALLTLRVMEAWIQAPADYPEDRSEQHVWLIQAREEDPPPGSTPVCWMLISTLAVPDAATAKLFVGYYTRRWLIERLHFVLKSGLRAERLQIDDGTSIAHALAIYYVVAWRLMQLTLLAREQPDAPVELVVDDEEKAVLSAATGRPVQTVAQAVRAIAKLGGHLPYQKTPPGLKVLWLGCRNLEQMVIGYRLARTGQPLWPSYEAR